MNAYEDINKNLEKLNLKDDINILLLGETGVGKSTFVNALANYIIFKDFKVAEAENLITLIPNLLTIQDKNGKRHKVQVGTSDKNENIRPGESATQDVKTYVFPIYDNTIKLRIIDTPGLVDTRGIDQDEINCEHILSYLSQLDQLHAICILLKSNNSRLTAGFQYCIRKILSHLDKSAAANIIFCFTGTRGSNFSAGESHACIEQIIESIKRSPPHAVIPFDKNIFCVDSEAYLYLAATKKNINLDSKLRLIAMESWDKSNDDCRKMVRYIHGDINMKPLVPHLLKATISINEIRRMINQLSQPLLDISQTIENNIRLLKKHQEKMKAHDQTLEELKASLFIPVVQLNEVKLRHPMTVCASASCVDVITIEGINSIHYRTKCHDVCSILGVTKEVVGDPGLLKCSIMDGSKKCRKCSCSFMTHMHIYYMTEKVLWQIVDEKVQRSINSKEQILRECVIHKLCIEQRIVDYQAEHDKVVEATALFAHFLQNNAITPFNDSYAGYIEYLLIREKYFGSSADQQTVLHLTNLKTQYDKIKNTFEEALKNGNQKVASPAQIRNKINDLFKLPLMGPTINMLYKAQKTTRKAEYKDTEYIHEFKSLRSPSKVQERLLKSSPTSSKHIENSPRYYPGRDTGLNPMCGPYTYPHFSFGSYPAYFPELFPGAYSAEDLQRYNYKSLPPPGPVYHSYPSCEPVYTQNFYSNPFAPSAPPLPTEYSNYGESTSYPNGNANMNGTSESKRRTRPRRRRTRSRKGGQS